MTSQAVLSVPTTPNLADLADSTSSAFEVLQPWCQKKFSSQALTLIAAQASCYVKAIDYSIHAAQQGFLVAEEAINLGKTLSASTEEQRQEYLKGMLKIVSDGQENAKKAHDQFRDVRQTVEQLIKSAKDEKHSTKHSIMGFLGFNRSELKKLQDGISVLETFGTCVGGYIAWWNFMKMSEHSQKSRVEQQTVNYSSLRMSGVVEKWEELKREYVTYTNKISTLQDKYPEFKTLVSDDAGLLKPRGAPAIAERPFATAQAGELKKNIPDLNHLDKFAAPIQVDYDTHSIDLTPIDIPSDLKERSRWGFKPMTKHPKYDPQDKVASRSPLDVLSLAELV